VRTIAFLITYPLFHASEALSGDWEIQHLNCGHITTALTG